MPKIRLNLDEISEGPSIVEPGKYLCKLTDIMEKESSSGNDMLVWHWDIIESTDGDDTFIGRELRSWTTLVEHALFGLKEHLEAFGESGEIDVDTDKYIGKKAILTVGKHKYKDRASGEEKEGTRVIAVGSALAYLYAVTTHKKKNKISDENVPF